MNNIDKIDLQLALKSKRYCAAISYGLLDQCNSKDLIELATLRNAINPPIDCNSHIHVKDMICPPDIQLQDEYKLIIGDPLPDTEILYGYYFFETGNTNKPIAVDIANDIATYPPNTSSAHYWTDVWNPVGIAAQIVSPSLCYHVIRLQNYIPPADIIDEAGVKVNAAWTVMTDNQYTYYVLQKVVAPSDVTYKVKES